MTSYRYLDRIIGDAAKLGPAAVAVAYPCAASSIDAALTARELGLIEPIMVGPRKEITDIAERNNLEIGGVEMVESGEDPAAAAAACVALCQKEEARFIMKGSLHTDELLGVMVSKEIGMRTGRRTSHAFVFDLPNYSKPLFMADCVVNINPGLLDKRDITQNAIDLARALGVDRPYVAILSAIETINPVIPGTVDAAALCKMADRGQIHNAIVDGPLAFDIAISLEAAKIKGIKSAAADGPDILIVPNLEAGNLLYKQLVYLAKAECAGVVLGTRVPVILTSRADSAKARVASCALAALYVNRRNALVQRSG
jgi:phosphate acetyltransferase